MTTFRDSLGENTVTQVTRIEYISIIFQCVAYLRDLFPEVVFIDDELQVAGVAIPIKSIVRNGSKQSDYFMECISVLEDPINLGFINSIHLGININSRDPNKFCEMYSFNITSFQDTSTSSKAKLIELCQVINRFNQAIQKLDDFPQPKTYELWVNFSSKYHCSHSIRHYDQIPRRSSKFKVSAKDCEIGKFDFKFGEVSISVNKSNQLSFESSIDTQHSDFISKLVFPPGKQVNRGDHREQTDTSQLQSLESQLLCQSKCQYDESTFVSLPCHCCGRLMILFCYGYQESSKPPKFCFSCIFGNNFQITPQLELLMYIRYTFKYILTNGIVSFDRLIARMNLNIENNKTTIRQIFNRLFHDKILMTTFKPNFVADSLELSPGYGILNFPIDGIFDFHGNKFTSSRDYYIVFTPSAKRIYPFLQIDIKLYSPSYATMEKKNLKRMLAKLKVSVPDMWTDSSTNTPPLQNSINTTESMDNNIRDSLISLSQQWSQTRAEESGANIPNVHD